MIIVFLEISILFITFFVGASVGSFMNVVCSRGSWKAALHGRSHCDGCGRALRWYHLIPVVSYLICRARCQKCQIIIPFSYFLVEILLGTLFVLAAIQLPDITLAFTILVASVFLVPMVVSDAVSFDVPEHLSLPFAWLTFGVASAYTFITLSVIPLLVGLGLAAPFFALWYFSKGKAMGLGDAKVALSLGFLIASPILAAVIFLYTFWFGVIAALCFILFSFLQKGGSIAQFRKREIPLLPFMALSFFVVLLGGATPFLILVGL